MSASLARTIELFWRQRVVYPSLRFFLRNTSIHLPIASNSFKRVLIIRNDRLGDMIATTPELRLLKRAFPTVFVGVLASPSNAALIRSNPYVDRVHVLRRGRLASLRDLVRIRRERYDLVLDFIFNRMTESGLLANVAAPRSTKIGAGDERYRPLFNALVPLQRYKYHMARVLMDYVQSVFGIVPSDSDLDMEIHLDDRSKAVAGAFLALHGLAPRGSQGRRFIVVNGSAPERIRQMSDTQLGAILRHLSSDSTRPVVAISAPSDRDRIARIVADIASDSCLLFPAQGNASLLEVAALIGSAECVITPDTSIVHIASATRTPVLACYATTAPVQEWLPYRVPNRVLIAERDQPVSSIPANEIIAALAEIPVNDGPFQVEG
jgi:ADP-heptose:LPS heptosyltransferase